jgi:hypothetical protein
MKVARNENLAIRLFHFFLLPGVIVHELAHLIVAEVMLVRTGGLSFTPEPDQDKIVMGSVGIEETDPIRRAIIGFSPVFMGILIISFFVFYFLSERSPLGFPWNYILVFFAVFQIGNTMFSSRKDLEGSLLLLIVISLIIIVAYFLGLRLPDGFIAYLNSESFTGIVKKGIWVLFFPIGIDLAIILLGKFSLRKN